jgi:hypothetical protein
MYSINYNLSTKEAKMRKLREEEEEEGRGLSKGVREKR